MCSARPLLAESDDGCRSGRDPEQGPCGEVDAFVGGLRRQHHGDQQLEGRFVFEFGPRVRIQVAQPLVDGAALGGIHRVGRATPARPRPFDRGADHGPSAGDLVWRQIVRVQPVRRAWREPCSATAPRARLALDHEPAPPCFIAGARLAGIALAPLAGGLHRHHRDAIHRTWRDTQVAAVAPLGDDAMHPPCRADDRIDRTRMDAQRAADAESLVDDRDAQRLLEPFDGFSGRDWRPVSAASLTMPAAPPGGHWLISARCVAIASA